MVGSADSPSRAEHADGTQGPKAPERVADRVASLHDVLDLGGILKPLPSLLGKLLTFGAPMRLE